MSILMNIVTKTSEVATASDDVPSGVSVPLNRWVKLTYQLDPIMTWTCTGSFKLDDETQ